MVSVQRTSRLIKNDPTNVIPVFVEGKGHLAHVLYGRDGGATGHWFEKLTGNRHPATMCIYHDGKAYA